MRRTIGCRGFGLAFTIALWAVASAAGIACAQSAATQPTSASTAPTFIESAVTTAPAAETPEAPVSSSPSFVPHPEGDIALSLKEASDQPAGVFPNGPASLVYPAWRQATDYLRDKYNLSLGAEMDYVYQAATGGTGTRYGSGMYTSLFGSWRLAGTPDSGNEGFLKFKGVYQFQIGDQPPAALGGQIGSLWKTSDSFNERSPQIAQIFWDQHLFNNLFVIDAGKLDPTNYYATNISDNDKQFFMSDAFSGIPAVGAPNNGLGINATFNPASWFYVTGGFQELQGTDSLEEVQDFFSDFNVFSAAEFGFRPNFPGLGAGNYRFTFWNAEGIPQRGTPADHGFDMSFDQFVAPHLVSFFRYEYDNGDLTGFRELATTGIGAFGPFISKLDVCGLGLAWGQPSKEPSREQTGGEAFYRLQITPEEQFSVGYELMVDPSNSPHDNVVGVFWTRFRILF